MPDPRMTDDAFRQFPTLEALVRAMQRYETTSGKAVLTVLCGPYDEDKETLRAWAWLGKDLLERRNGGNEEGH